MKAYLLLSHVKIHNANALSSPYTIGFPAMTAWLGGIHALERQVRAAGLTGVGFTAVAVSCHECRLQTYKGRGDYYRSIIITGNPLRSNGERAPFIEEARCHLDVSLLVELSGVNPDNEKKFRQVVETKLQRQKLASGDIERFNSPTVYFIDELDSDDDARRLLRRLMPGNVLVERRDLLMGESADGDQLSRLLSYLAVEYTPDNDDSDKEPAWTGKRKTSGWLVPIAVGYRAISPVGQVANQRDPDTPHCFAESVVTLGEFRMPYRFDDIDLIMWRYEKELAATGLYICRNQCNDNVAE